MTEQHKLALWQPPVQFAGQRIRRPPQVGQARAKASAKPVASAAASAREQGDPDVWQPPSASPSPPGAVRPRE